MDPNAALARIRALISALSHDDDGTQSTVGEDLALQVADLDHWLSNGGFKPDAWVRYYPPITAPQTH